MLKSHAKVKKEWLGKKGRILLFHQDTDPGAMEEFYKFVASMPFPKGNKKALKAAGTSAVLRTSPTVLMITSVAGFAILHSGDHVLARSIRGSLKEDDDVLQMWVTGEYV